MKSVGERIQDAQRSKTLALIESIQKADPCDMRSLVEMVERYTKDSLPYGYDPKPLPREYYSQLLGLGGA